MSIIVRELLKAYHYGGEQNIDLDIAIDSLYNSNILNTFDIELIYLLKEQYSAQEMALLFGIDSTTVYRKIKVICKKIADRLGDDYKDNKIFSSIEFKLGRKLTDEELLFCEDMLVRFGYKKNKNLNIYNFNVINGKVTKNGKNEEE